MRLLKIINPEKVDKNNIPDWKYRKAVRAVVFDKENKVGLLYVSSKNYYKLPGGGIDDGEDRIKALKREAMEEVGSEIEVTDEVGKIIEYRSKYNLKQISYCYLGKIISKGNPKFTEEELNCGFKLVWLFLDEAISKIESDKPINYEGAFIQQRDLEFLKKAKQKINQEI